ncbi:hypothetical protein FOZ63_005913 [Perkinsus olseni]|uniref:HTH La-type RNA-binding domain-containing protein n=1 Tax=Perkinsus olseni TaxID=32597 RepID=A0A7J6TBD0_PEROL|nr:hypothetical protein FOZ63_005913 [Perkinsus olseni]KAF4742604.1 hypothetical protein FOZ62_028777 [Perkinsus olseni]
MIKFVLLLPESSKHRWRRRRRNPIGSIDPCCLVVREWLAAGLLEFHYSSTARFSLTDFIVFFGWCVISIEILSLHDGLLRFDDWHEKVEDLRAGQFVKFRSLQADPVTGRSKLLEPEVWKLLALDNGKAVLVDCKGRHDVNRRFIRGRESSPCARFFRQVIPEKDMFGLLVHDPEENAPSADKPQQQQQKQIGQHVASPANKKGPKISSLAYVPPIASDKAALKRQKKKFGSIRRQVEWWLNKPNWEKDEHLRSLAYPGTHWVPVHELMKFERLRDLSDDQAEVVHVMRTERCGKQDPRLEVSPDGYYVRHKCWVEADTAGGPKTAA